MKRVLSLVLIVSMLLAVFPITYAAAASGSCGENLTWSYHSATGELVISGSGPMTEFNSISGVPWYDYKDSMKKITVNEGVTSIGRYAFYHCRSVTEVKLPNTLQSIGRNGFQNCFALGEITLPNSLRTIANDAFYWNSSLKSIVIPEGVTQIGDDAFGYCSVMTSVSMPSSLRMLGESAFAGCAKLTSVTFPTGLEKIPYRIFMDCTALTTVGIPDTVTVIDREAFRWCPALKTIHYGGTGDEWASLAAKNGIYTDSYFEALQKATVHCAEAVTPSGMVLLRHEGKTYDLLSQPVNIVSGSSTAVEVMVDVAVLDTERVWLSQNTAAAVELTPGVWQTIKPAEIFTSGLDIYLLITESFTGEARTEKTRLQILSDAVSDSWKPSAPEGLNFKLGSEIGFTIPEDVPVFGGTEIKWDFDFIPISVEYDRQDSEKLNVVFGANIMTTDEGDGETEYFSDFDFDGYKNAVKKAASKQGRSLKQLRNDFKISNKQTMNLFGGKVLGGGSGKSGTDVDIAGYAEMKVIDGELKFIEGQLCLEAELSATYQGQLFIWVVPVYYEIGADVGGGFEGTMVDVSAQSFVPEFEAYLTAKVGAHIGAGLGVAGVATVGANGGGSLNFRKSLQDEYLKVWGEGSADFNVKLFGKTVAEKPFAKGDFLIYETGNPDGLLGGGVALAAWNEGGLYAAIDRNGVYENESRHYLENPTEWYGAYPPVSLMAVDYTNKNLQLLAENVYTESAPIICDINGQKVMVMLWDDEDRADIDRTMLVWSAYDEDTATWSEPVAVHNDGTADFYPSFCDGWVVWQNQKTVMDDAMTLEQIAALGEIYAANWNGAGFDAPIAVTNNDTLDTLPAVCANGGEVTVVWLTNTENDILGLSGSNGVESMVLGGEAHTVVSGLSAVTDLAVDHVDGAVQIVYAEDTDNNLETLTDRELYLNGELLTDNDVLDSNPVFAAGKLYFYCGGNIAVFDLEAGTRDMIFAEPASGLTDTFTVAANESDEVAVWWSSSVEGGAEIFCTLNTDGAWSDLIQLTEAGNQSRYPTGLLEEDGSMYLAFCNSTWEDGDIAQSDLYTLQVEPSYDLAVENVYVDEVSMKVYATVRNYGERAVDTYTVSLTDTVLNNKLTVTEPIKAGAAAEVEITYNVPENMSKREVTLTVSSAAEEYDLSNNTAALTIGRCDVIITNIDSYEMLPKTVVVAEVTNAGYSNSGVTTVCLRQNAADGEVHRTTTVENLAPGESAEVTFTYRAENGENVLWYVTAETDAEEISGVNNAEYFVNEYINTVTPYGHDIVCYEQQADTLIVNAYAENNTDADLTAQMLLMVYDENGKVKTETVQTITVPAYDNVDILFTPSCILEDSDTMKLFVLNESKATFEGNGMHSVLGECVCGEKYTALETCTYADGICTKCGSREIIKINPVGTIMDLGNEIVLKILVEAEEITGEGLTAYMTHHAADGDITYEYPQSQWTASEEGYYRFCAPVCAKQMTDQVSLEIRDEEGNVYNNAYSTSVRDYVGRVLDLMEDSYTRTLMVDMVNYGAAAQEYFGYKTDDLANAKLTEEQKAFATTDVALGDDLVKDVKFAGSSLNLQERILMNVYFDAAGITEEIAAQMYAVISFTGYRGNEESKQVPMSFGKYGLKAEVDQIVLGDSFEPVTVTVYNADGSVYSKVTDSVESYIGRMAGKDQLYMDIIRFAWSAKEYLLNR